jgi:hypothetical protein
LELFDLFQILNEVEDVIHLLERDLKENLKEIDVARYTELGVGSVIHNVLFGYRFDEVCIPIQ